MGGRVVTVGNSWATYGVYLLALPVIRNCYGGWAIGMLIREWGGWMIVDVCAGGRCGV